MSVQIRFLGTSAAEGTPAFYCDCPVCVKAARLGGRNIRTRSQVLVNENLLMDYPPDTYYHMVSYGLDLKKVEHLLITHSHEDHFIPHDILMNASPYNAGTIHHRIQCYGNQKVAGILKRHAGNGDCNMDIHAVTPFEEFQAGEYKILPLRALHDPAEDCLLFGVEGLHGRRFLLGNDTGFFPDDTMERIRGLRFDAIALDCTLGKDRGGDNHMGFEDILEMRKRLIQNGNACEHTQWIAQHFSHNCGAVYNDAQTLLAPHGFTVAYDGMTVQI